MSDDPAVLIDAIDSLDLQDKPAVRAFAQRVEALGDAEAIESVCSRSRAVRAALGMLRAELLTQLLARDERDEFIRRASDSHFMSPVDLTTMKVPRYVAVEEHACVCGAALMVPYDRQGGPGYGFDCPTCSAAYLARPVYREGEYRVSLEQDLRPAKKRKRRSAHSPQ
jgi:hypothetical protein